MSTFYLLPPRRFLADYLASHLLGVFPGLDWSAGRSTELVEALTTAAGTNPDVYVVHREDLPHSVDLGRGLTEGFGAEEGDRVIEVDIGARPGDPPTRTWFVGSPC